MWLINTETLRLHEFGEDGPPYAILSHRWRENEVTFRQIQEMSHASLEGLQGWNKIRRFCDLAHSRGFAWAWVDTCCIDKSSSAELSEAVNSMYRWYQNSNLCCVYLSDVHPEAGLDKFEQSEWFKRGWTLQELIAPQQGIEFYCSDWSLLGTRHRLCVPISRATKIPVAILYESDSTWLFPYSIAQRMSWASSRKTTRSEDMAYCLMGIFNVNMPLIYGEGGLAAFRRLQLEIMRNSNDESIFASNCYMLKLLADSPSLFTGAGEIAVGSTKTKPRHYSMTNRGLQIRMTLYATGSPFTFTAAINCNKRGRPLYLFLKKEPGDQESGATDAYYRDGLSEEFRIRSDSKGSVEDILIVSSGYSEGPYAKYLGTIQLSKDLADSLDAFQAELKLRLYSIEPDSDEEVNLACLDYCSTGRYVPVLAWYAEVRLRLHKSGVPRDWSEDFLSRLEQRFPDIVTEKSTASDHCLT